MDHHGGSANLYFRTSRRISAAETARLVALAGGEPPEPSLYADMEAFTPPDGYTFSVTMNVSDGEIQRVGIYALPSASRAAAAMSRHRPRTRRDPRRPRGQIARHPHARGVRSWWVRKDPCRPLRDERPPTVLQTVDPVRQ
ncbi:aromatic prenyltransferase [Spirillospora sp. NPDC052269]